MQLVTRVHFRSRDKDGVYTIRSAVSENPVLQANLKHHSSMFDRKNGSYCRSKFYIAGIGIFDLFGSCDLDLDQMTFIYELHIRTRPVVRRDDRMCKYELPTSRLSKVIVWTDRQTDTTKIIQHASSRAVNNNSNLRFYTRWTLVFL